MKYGGADTRRGAIMEQLRSKGFLEVARWARALSVSEMTVRRDLRQLQREGSLHLLRGGASLPLSARGNGFDARAAVDAEAKRRIGKQALEWITPGDTIAIDAGTTAFALAEALPAGLVNCIVTPSLPVMQLLADRDEPLTIGLAGDLRPDLCAWT
jgi:DeoR/GlpR family transcriptional regulator of sugar metabolism